MTVIRPNSISGITSITAQANEINVFKSDGTLAGLSLNGVNVNTTTGISTYAALNVTGNVSVGGTLTYQDVTNVDAVGLITARAGVNVSGGQLDVGSNIKIGNAGVITATSFSGSGANLTGISQVGGSTGVDFNDNVKARFGTGNDLSLFHDGTNSFVQNNTGYLGIQADTLYLQDKTDGHAYITCVNDGAVGLRYDNSQKLATTSSGIQVTGQVYADSAHVNGELDLVGNLDLNSDTHKIKLGAGDDFQLYHNGSNNYIYTNNGDIIMQTDGDDIQLLSNDDIILKVQGGVETAINCVGNGAVELYHNNLKTAETVANGLQITATENNHASLYLWADEGDDNADKWQIMATTQGQLRFYNNASGSSENTIVLDGNGAVDLYYDNSLKFKTDNGGTITQGTSTYTTHYLRNSGGYNQGRVQGWRSGGGNDCEIGFAHHDSANWFVRFDRNNSSGAVMEYHWQDVRPAANNTYDLGSTSYRWANVYTNDLHLSNEGSTNSVDNTWGNYTIQEGESDLFLINNRNGKKYKFNLTEVS